MSGPTADFWQQRFEQGQTPWDRGAASPQLQRWVDAGLIKPGQQVLVPGCGRGWEVQALAALGARVTGIDYAAAALQACAERLQSQGLSAQLVQADVLQWAPPQPADLVYEQTCLCALHPDFWVAYASRLQAWLSPGGQLALLAMQFPRPRALQGVIEGPPYHVDIHALRALFPSSAWAWSAPPYATVAPPSALAAGGPLHELALVLTRLPAAR